VSPDATLTAGGPPTVDAAGPPAAWAAEHRDRLTALLAEHGAVLIRGLPLTGGADTVAVELAAVRDALGLAPDAPAEDFAVRADLGHGVHQAADWPGDREMCLHHERSYGVDYPRLLLMACVRPADSGGATMLADTTAVLRDLPAELAARFRDEGWLLVRNFRPHFGLPWSVAFGASAPADVERMCAARRIDCEWLRDGALHTAQRRPATIRHPVTGVECWFNQIAFFSQWSVDRVERDILLSTFGANGIPFNTAFGSGEPISEAQYRAILDAYDHNVRRVHWRAGDLLLVDNVRTAHGRDPYTGAREIVVALAGPVDATP
jgi:alpha-ketoglutarate-dependent taurine dioxygenase